VAAARGSGTAEVRVVVGRVVRARAGVKG